MKGQVYEMSWLWGKGRLIKECRSTTWVDVDSRYVVILKIWEISVLKKKGVRARTCVPHPTLIGANLSSTYF